MKQNKNSNRIAFWMLIGVILILCFIAYLITRGEFTFSVAEINKDLKRNLEELKEYQQKLLEKIRIKTEKLSRYQQVVKRTYFYFRIAIVSIWLAPNLLAYYVWQISLNTLREVNAMGLVTLTIILFVVAGTTTFKEIIDVLKRTFEEQIYGNDLNIASEIEEHITESKKVQDDIERLTKLLGDGGQQQEPSI